MTKKSAFFWLIYVSVLFLVIITQRVQRITTASMLAERNTQITEKQMRNDYLSFEISKCKSPQHLIAQTQKRLNLSMPEPDRVVILKDIHLEGRKYHKTLIAKFLNR